MALSRIRNFKDSSSIISQLNNYSGVKQCIRKTIAPIYLSITKTVNFHLSNIRHYPNAPQLTLPRNVVDIFGNETGRFTPERARDIAEPILLYGTGSANRQNQRKTWDVAEKWSSSNRSFRGDKTADVHVNSYDCFGAISLHSSMQTTVPKPFCSEGKSTYLNMPGGQWSLEGKYIAAEIIQKSYYTVLKQRENSKPFKNGCCMLRVAEYSTSSSSVEKNEKPNDEIPLTNVQKLKRAVKDYGKTVLVFHISISLVSLGTFYLLVSSGLDMTSLIKMMPGSSEKLETIMANSSTFLIAYAIHKIFAPVRISITLTATPFIVRYLRKVGFLKKTS